MHQSEGRFGEGRPDKEHGGNFKLATQVIIWLGSEEPATSLAFSELKKLASLVKPRGIRDIYDYLMLSETDSLDNFIVETVESNIVSQLSNWQAVGNHLRHDWWRRVWVI